MCYNPVVSMNACVNGNIKFSPNQNQPGNDNQNQNDWNFSILVMIMNFFHLFHHFFSFLAFASIMGKIYNFKIIVYGHLIIESSSR